MTVRMGRRDQLIGRQITDQLRWDARVQPHRVVVDVAAGVARLAGSVDSCVKVWLIDRLVTRVSGVHTVVNSIRVDLPDSMYRTDSDIEDAARRALRRYPAVPSAHVTVTVADGWVRLNGVVGWNAQKSAAQNAVMLLTGVRGVDNRVVIDGAGPDPERLKRRLRRALVQKAEVEASRVEVDVVDGLVVLRGTVRGWADRHEIEHAAWSTPGTTFVENRIALSFMRDEASRPLLP
jgi:osmotically-inducible protein OsmY